jgi:hypothetical protein
MTPQPAVAGSIAAQVDWVQGLGVSSLADLNELHGDGRGRKVRGLKLKLKLTLKFRGEGDGDEREAFVRRRRAPGQPRRVGRASKPGRRPRQTACWIRMHAEASVRVWA